MLNTYFKSLTHWDYCEHRFEINFVEHHLVANHSGPISKHHFQTYELPSQVRILFKRSKILLKYIIIIILKNDFLSLLL